MYKRLVEKDELKAAARVIRAVNHKMRQDIINLLDVNNRLSVTEIYKRMKIDQTVASTHLAILRKEGIVKVEREAKCRYYYLAQERIEEIIVLAAGLAAKKR